MTTATKIETRIGVQGAEILVPMKPTFIDVPATVAGDVLNGKLNIRFPEQCPWCGSTAIVGSRQIEIGIPNPDYLTPDQRALRQAGAVVGAVALGALTGGSSVNVFWGYTRLKPDDIQKVKRFALSFSNIPFCAEHANATAEDAFTLIDSGFKSGMCRIKVRDNQYAESIAQRFVESLTTQRDPLTITMTSIKGLTWANQCVTCATPNVETRIPIPVKNGATGWKVEVPFCSEHADEYSHLGKVSSTISNLSGVVALVAVVLTLPIDATTVGHIVLAIVAFLVAFTAAMSILDRFFTRRLGKSVVGWKDPIRIKYDEKSDVFVLQFTNPEVAEAAWQRIGGALPTK